MYEDWQEETGVKVIAVSIDDARNMSKVNLRLMRYYGITKSIAIQMATLRELWALVQYHTLFYSMKIKKSFINILGIRMVTNTIY